MGRYPWIEPLKSTGNIGFHNDYFGPVPHSDEFDEAVFESKNGSKGLLEENIHHRFLKMNLTRFI